MVVVRIEMRTVEVVLRIVVSKVVRDRMVDKGTFVILELLLYMKMLLVFIIIHQNPDFDADFIAEINLPANQVTSFSSEDFNKFHPFNNVK